MSDEQAPDGIVAHTRQIKHGQLHVPSPLAAGLRLLAVAVVVILVSAISVVAYAAHDVVASAKPLVHIPTLPGQTATPIPSAPQGETVGEVNMLLIGSDTRSGQGDAYSDAADQAASSGLGNNDVNILIHISSDHTNVSVISFPRDLEIPIPACPTASGTSEASDKAMLNTALGRGGDEAHGLGCAVLTIEKLTGLNIPYAASVTFDGTSAISTAIGGVHVCLATSVVDDNVTPPLDLSPGEHTLVGPEALSFLRSRHGVGDGSDLGRISNQQVFMSSLARQLVSGGTLSDPFKLYNLAKAASANMRLSDTLNVPTLLGIFQAVHSVGLSNIVFAQYPTGEDPDDSNRVVPNAAAAAVLNGALTADRPFILTGTTGDGSQADPSSTGSPSATRTPSATSTSTASPGSTGAVTLPPSVTGQTAAEKTCSRKLQ